MSLVEPRREAGTLLDICRVGQNRIYTYIYTVYLVISKPKIPYVHRIYMVLANPRYMPSVWQYIVYSQESVCSPLNSSDRLPTTGALPLIAKSVQLEACFSAILLCFSAIFAMSSVEVA